VSDVSHMSTIPILPHSEKVRVLENTLDLSVGHILPLSVDLRRRCLQRTVAEILDFVSCLVRFAEVDQWMNLDTHQE
jgi:hypothetical protein